MSPVCCNDMTGLELMFIICMFVGRRIYFNVGRRTVCQKCTVPKLCPTPQRSHCPQSGSSGTQVWHRWPGLATPRRLQNTISTIPANEQKKNGSNKHNLGRKASSFIGTATIKNNVFVKKMGFFSYNSKHCNVFYLVATPWVRRKSRNWHCDLSVQGDWGCHF